MNEPPTHELMAGLDQMMYQTEHDAARRSCGIGIYILDKTPAFDDVEYAFERLSRVFLRYRQRVIAPILGFGPAYWVVDPDFDIKYHVRRVQLPKDTPLRAIIDRLEIELMSPTELERPLWYVMLFEGLENGRSALAMRGSHAIGDGVGGRMMLPLLFDSTRRARRRPMPPVPAGDHPNYSELYAETWRTLPRATLGSLRDLASSVGNFSGRLLRDPKAMATEIRELGQSLQSLSSPGTETSPLLAGRSLSRRVTWLELSLTDLKRAACTLGGSVNDGYLAGLCCALRHYHEKLGTTVDKLSVAMPINIRAADRKEVAGNQIATAMVDLPVGDRDLARCVREIHEQVQQARKNTRFAPFGAAMAVLGYLPPSVISRLMGAMPLPDIAASNLPGPTDELFLGGARVEKMIGIGPVIGAAMLVGLTAHREAGTVSVTYDPAAVTDAKSFQESLEQGFAEILDLAVSEAAPRRGQRGARAPPKKAARAARRAREPL